MTWTYTPTEAELEAAASLREKGWEVRQPTCPECNGWGRKLTFKAPENYVVGEGLTISTPCSWGCPYPSFTFTHSDVAAAV